MMALIWKDLGSYSFAHEHRSYAAQGATGKDYVIGINTDLKSGSFSGYYVEIEPSTILGRNLRSIDEAKALAQQDHDRG